ncbi:MAG: DUF2066 domain-containing protein [Thiomicrorhabdus sp.]|nr:DUF2066 domain-containing protein [Thiomicrorhabdus sp.]
MTLSTQASLALESKTEQVESFFKVTLPYKGEPSVHQSLGDAMAILLVRLTGQKQFLTSRVAQAYLKNPKAWLKTYNIVPRTEEGVLMGRNIVYTFLEDKLRQEFHQRFVPIWPLSIRPETLVLGSLHQGGTVTQLTDETLQYRVDAEFRAYPKKIKLPIALPSYQWDVPMPSETDSEPFSPTASTVLKVLAKSNQHYLLRFQVQMRGGQKNRLIWVLYHSEGVQVVSGELIGGNVTTLTEQMFDDVMTYYVQNYVQIKEQITDHDNVSLQPILLTVHDVMNVKQMAQFESLLKSNPDTVRSVALVSMQAGRVQYRITPQMNYQAVLNWIEGWPESALIEGVSADNVIEINVTPNFFSDKTE